MLETESRERQPGKLPQMLSELYAIRCSDERGERPRSFRASSEADRRRDAVPVGASHVGVPQCAVSRVSAVRRASGRAARPRGGVGIRAYQ